MFSEMEDKYGHNPTVYNSRDEMEYVESGKWYADLEKAEKPSSGCWNCMNFDWKHEACTLNWNNMDEFYYNPDTDDRELTDYCGEWEEDPEADPECLEFGGNEP